MDIEVTTSWSPAACEQVIPSLTRELELTERRETQMQREQRDQGQQLEQLIKVAQDQRNYDKGKELTDAKYKFVEHWSRAFQDLKKYTDKLNQSLTMAKQIVEQAKKQNDQNQQL